MYFWDPWDSAETHAEGFSQILMCKGVAGFQSWTHFGEFFSPVLIYTEVKNANFGRPDLPSSQFVPQNKNFP